MAAESALDADGSRLQSGNFIALRNAISDLRDQVGDGEPTVHAALNSDAAGAQTVTSALDARLKTRAESYAQARQAAIDDLLAASVPPIPEIATEARVASMGGLLRDAIKSGAKVDKLVSEAIARNDNLALNILLGDSLWPLMVAQGVDMRKLRVSAAEQRWAAGQDFPGSTLLGYLCGDGAELGQTSYAAGVAKFNATKRAQTKTRREQGGR
jgi:hypothetical protein